MLRSLAGSRPVVNRKPVRTRDYSVEVQRSGPATLPAMYHNLHVVSVFLERESVVVRRGPEGPTTHRYRLGESYIGPAGPGNEVEWPEGTHCLHVHLHPRLVRRIGASTSDTEGVGLEPRARLCDPRIREIGLELREAVGRGRPVDERAARELVVALAHHVVGGYAAPSPSVPWIGRLSLEAVMDAFRERVADWRGVASLAEEAGLTRAHFTREVRRRTGLSPYAMVAGSRIEAAKHLLERGDASLSEVAYRTGFADQSHLTRTFRRATGSTPAPYRARGGRAGGLPGEAPLG